MSERRQWGWAGTVAAFLETPADVWLASLRAHHGGLLQRAPARSQVDAWEEEGAVMRAALRDVCIARPEAIEWGVAFEYELPLEGGRRPDVVVLAGRSVCVLEFKQQARPTHVAADQVVAYARDLAEYHQASHGRPVHPALVLTRAADAGSIDEIPVLSPDDVAGFLLGCSGPGPVELTGWLESDYEPLPMLVAAARRIFQGEPLPQIRRVLSSRVPAAIDTLERIIDEVHRDGGRVLALLTGVPGSGKTLAGLTLVYQRSKKAPATFLSGNGPLVEVLRDALRSGVFVKDLHAFIRQYGLQPNRPPTHHVIVFDEAQRAWDVDQVQTKWGVARSEPDLLVDVAERLPQWAALVGLVGQGQEIHVGEEAGMRQWDDAVDPEARARPWTVHCGPSIAGAFTRARVVQHEVLDLDADLRARQAERLHRWVDALLTGRLADAAREAASIRAQAFTLYVTRDLDDARAYVLERYGADPEARYGLLASSKSGRLLVQHGADATFMATKNVRIARWFNEPRGHPSSCCALVQPVTEFQCQGLELDLPIVCWSDDHVWTGSRWFVKPVRARQPLRDPERIRQNAYRVLLTRGRDGLVVFVPPVPALDATEHALLAAGMRPLQSGLAAAAGA